MSPGPRAGDEAPLWGRGRRLRLLTALVTALGCLAGCGGESGGESGDESGDGRRPGRPTSAATASPWPSDELIVFERGVVGAEERALYAVGPEGGEPRLVTQAGGYPHWSADGGTLAFGACLDPPDCTTATALLERATGEVRGLPMPDPTLFTGCLVWAPSGRELACLGLSHSDRSRNGVYTIRATDGEGFRRLTRNPGGEDAPLAFSPDGTQLLIERLAPSRGRVANRALFIAPVAGGEARRITPWGFSDDYAGWSPDGRTIVFGTDGALYRVDPDGRGLAEIPVAVPGSSARANAFDVAFSPDGDGIVFSLGSPSPGIYTARLDGSGVQRITQGQDHHANWGSGGG